MSSGILSEAEAADKLDMIRKQENKLKEKQVLEKHLNKKGVPYVINELHYLMRGKPVVKWSTSAPWKGCKAKIQKYTYKEVIDELYSHYFPASRPEDMTLQEAYEKFIQKTEKRETVSSGTITHYRSDWNRFLLGKPNKKADGCYERSVLLDMRISDITVRNIRDFYEYIVGDGKIGKSTFGNLRTVLKKVFSYAYAQDVMCIDVERVPYDGLHFQEPLDHSTDVYTPEEREKLLTYLESLPQDCYTLSVQLMFTLCVRIGELRALTWDDIDYTNPKGPVMKIRHQIVDKKVGNINRKATDVDYMKSHSPAGKREFPLSDYALYLLEQLKEINSENRYILTNEGGENSIYTNRFNEHLKKYCEGAGIRYLSSHKIRFYAVSQMYDMEVAEKDIMALAGHSNVSTTRHYNRRLKEIAMSEAQLQEGFGREFVRKPLQTSPSGKESDIAG